MQGPQKGRTIENQKCKNMEHQVETGPVHGSMEVVIWGLA